LVIFNIRVENFSGERGSKEGEDLFGGVLGGVKED
jgi:hypothetical protein